MEHADNVSKEIWYKRLYNYIYDKIIKEDMLANLRSKLISIASILLISYIIILLKEKMSFSVALDETWKNGGILFVISVIMTEVWNYVKDVKKVIGNLEGKFNEHAETIDNKVINQLNYILDKSRIVFHVDIEPFDYRHIKIVRDIMDRMQEKEAINSFYAIDHTSPNQWWTNSMLGYLACQARWTARNKDNKVHRIFVLTKGEMSSPIGKKIIQLHHLMGFETYIMLDIYYEKYVDDYDNKEKIDLKREFFTWNDSTTTNKIEFLINYTNKCNLYGYRSYWDIMSTNEERKNMVTATTITGRNIQLDNNTTKMELLKGYICKAPQNNKSNGNNYEEIIIKYVDFYLRFIKRLINDAAVCEQVDAVEGIRCGSDIVHLPAESSIDIETISNIIDKYIEECDTMLARRESQLSTVSPK
ncbi:MAG: hypothetical protein H7843_11420 [Nitrospirota bacterium]